LTTRTCAKATTIFGILVINKSFHNHPLEDLIKEKHRMGVTLIGVGRRKD
jgi:hypothetical protein